MVKKEEVVKMASQLMDNTENIRNIGIVAHIDHGKTTLTDSLVAASGLISEELAGKQLVMDFYELEQQRGITINAANISLVYKYDRNNQYYLINVIDTPGHVDFGGDVIRAMRAVDGVIVVVDAVEGPMPQTETVIRQALREWCKPILFINKIDRLIKELQLSAEEMQQKLFEVITKVNKLIKANAPEQFKEEWLVNVEKGSVVFGSALHKWAISVPLMKETGMTFKDIYKYMQEGKSKELSKKLPLYKAVMEAVINHLPNPKEAQKYRIKQIWQGDIESETGKAMQECRKDAPLAMMITDVTVDKHAGEIATGRIYSGTLKKGMKVKLINSKKEATVLQVNLYMGPDRIPVEKVPAGNIAAIVGLKDIYVGETISTENIEPFESFKSKLEPVITVRVEPKDPKMLPKLIEVLRQITKEDPNIQLSINKETGEHLISGMGELHLEVTKYRIEVDNGIPVEMGSPIVVYRETIKSKSEILQGRTPNKHNDFFISVEAMPKEMRDKLKELGYEGKIRAKKDEEKIKELANIGFGLDDAKRIWYIHNNNVIIDNTRGIQALHEVKELIIQAFKDAMDAGPLAKEKCTGIIVRLHDARLHEDAIHRGPAQVLPAVTRTIYACIMKAQPTLLEPKQKLFISVPQEYVGNVAAELNQRRGQILEIRTEGDQNIIIAVAPVRDLIGFSNAIRSVTQGRAIWTAEFYDYEEMPKALQPEVIAEIRKRKGLDPEPKPAEYYLQ